MLFDVGDTRIESEKERNLYYKIFCGYWFNELVPGFADRLARFCHIANHPMFPAGKPLVPIVLSPNSSHISFDNHAYLFQDHNGDRGELADVLIHDVEAATIICIEAKLHSNFTYEKDVEANVVRLPNVTRKVRGCNFVHECAGMGLGLTTISPFTNSKRTPGGSSPSSRN